MPAKRVQWLFERKEVTGNEPGPLVNELIERVLAVGSWLTPVNRTGLVTNLGPTQRDMFAVTLHRQLLEVSRESLQVLLIGQYRDSFRSKETAVPHSQETHECRQVAVERGSAEVFVHVVKAIQHRPEVIR